MGANRVARMNERPSSPRDLTEWLISDRRRALVSALGLAYRQYEHMMAHWREALDVEILDVDYEAMVDDQEGMSRRVIEFCDLEWDEECLVFYKTERAAGTLSYDQVRQPIYRSGLDYWRNFEPWLGPLKAALGPDVCQRYGLDDP